MCRGRAVPASPTASPAAAPFLFLFLFCSNLADIPTATTTTSTSTTHALHTVIAHPVKLPKIEQPTADDVAHWHGRYVAALQAIYDDHKARFGYGDRELDLQ